MFYLISVNRFQTYQSIMAKLHFFVSFNLFNSEFVSFTFQELYNPTHQDLDGYWDVCGRLSQNVYNFFPLKNLTVFFASPMRINIVVPTSLVRFAVKFIWFIVLRPASVTGCLLKSVVYFCTVLWIMDNLKRFQFHNHHLSKSYFNIFHKSIK